MGELSEAEWQAIERYFTPVTETFWTWSHDHQEIMWRLGETIVFRAELVLLLEPLVTSGWPPLDSILLTIAACRSNSSKTLPELPERLQFSRYPMAHSLSAQVEQLRVQLTNLSSLPADLRGNLDGRQTILTLVAENGSQVTGSDFAANCLEWLRQGYRLGKTVEGSPLPIETQFRTIGEWAFLLRGLQDGLASINEAAVRLRLRTGLEPVDLPAPLPLELPEPTPTGASVWDWLKELEHDEEHAGLFFLVKRLLAIVTLPRPLSAPADQPLGGVSDISNRGPFDRLLMSELAHDDDVLMTRVALDEALYIRREVPPTVPPRNRMVLLDAGIRMWGLPRLYTAAVALSLAVTQHKLVTTCLFRAENDDVVPVDLTSREEFLDHLGVLEVALHPGAALPAFVKASDHTAADFVIVTGEDVFADPEFRRSLSEQKLSEYYLILVNRAGSLRLIHRTRQGERVLKQALIDLQQILETRPATKPQLTDPEIHVDLPAIFHVRPFPLLLCHRVDRENWKKIDLPDFPDAGLAVTNDRRLLLWRTKSEWAVQLSDRMPPGRLIWSAGAPDHLGRIRVVVGNLVTGNVYLVIVEPEGDGFRAIHLSSIPGPILGLSDHAGNLHVVLADQTLLFSLRDGSRLGAKVHPPEMTWVQGRFYVSRSEYLVLTCDSKCVEWETFLSQEQVSTTVIKSVFDCQVLSSPVVITDRNQFFYGGIEEAIEFQSKYLSEKGATCLESNVGCRVPGYSRMKVTEISWDGKQVRLTPETVVAGNAVYWDVNLITRVATEVQVSPARNRAEDPLAAQSGNLRTRFQMIGTLNSNLVLLTNKQKFVSIELDTSRKKLCFVPRIVDRSAIQNLSGFRPLGSLQGRSIELKIVEWSEGTRIYLDSRGLLHLRSGDPAIPEMTLVLHDREVSGWCQQNLVWGDVACTGTGKTPIPATDAFNKWLRPFCERVK